MFQRQGIPSKVVLQLLHIVLIYSAPRLRDPRISGVSAKVAMFLISQIDTLIQLCSDESLRHIDKFLL